MPSTRVIRGAALALAAGGAGWIVKAGLIHIEWPILLIGAAWFAAGLALWRSAAITQRSRSSAP